MYTVPIMTESKNTLSAVIKTGGKQYHVAVGNTIVVEKLDGELAAGGNFTFSDGRKYEGDWLNNQMHGRGKY